LQHHDVAVWQTDAVDRKSSVWQNSGFSLRNKKKLTNPTFSLFQPNPKWQDKQLKRFFFTFLLVYFQFTSNNETALQASHNNAVEVAAIKSKSLSDSETEMVEARMVERATHLAEKCAYYGLDVHGESMRKNGALIES